MVLIHKNNFKKLCKWYILSIGNTLNRKIKKRKMLEIDKTIEYSGFVLLLFIFAIKLRDHKTTLVVILS